MIGGARGGVSKRWQEQEVGKQEVGGDGIVLEEGRAISTHFINYHSIITSTVLFEPNMAVASAPTAAEEVAGEDEEDIEEDNEADEDEEAASGQGLEEGSANSAVTTGWMVRASYCSI